MHRNDMDTAVARKPRTERQSIQILLKDRQIGERGFFGKEPLGHSVVVTEEGGNKQVVFDTPTYREINGESLIAEQIRRVDWNNDRHLN